MISESKIQSKIIALLKADNWIVVKTIVLNDSGYPDIFAFRNKETLFVEVKSEKGVLSTLQKYRIERLKNEGFNVYVCHSVADFNMQYKPLLRYSNELKGTEKVINLLLTK